jgi:hypothetical protein
MTPRSWRMLPNSRFHAPFAPGHSVLQLGHFGRSRIGCRCRHISSFDNMRCAGELKLQNVFIRAMLGALAKEIFCMLIFVHIACRLTRLLIIFIDLM